ncbi:MAG: hypothetical protein HYZ63_03330 [Candidatus Andersenbacteria bacterium]|nr:hypothetical protein [Candidatus Andersenbacteria bacterium]
MANSPERMLPHYIGGDLSDPDKEAEVVEVPAPSAREVSKEKYRERQEQLRKAPDWEKQLREYVQGEGRDVPENINLSLKYIEDFEAYVRDAQALRKLLQTLQNGRLLIRQRCQW